MEYDRWKKVMGERLYTRMQEQGRKIFGEVVEGSGKNEGKIKEAEKGFIGKVVDTLDIVSTSKSRVGDVMQRVSYLHSHGFNVAEIAKELSNGSTKGHQYTAQEVIGMLHVYRDCKTKVLLTKAKTIQLSKDQAKSAGHPIRHKQQVVTI